MMQLNLRNEMNDEVKVSRGHFLYPPWENRIQSCLRLCYFLPRHVIALVRAHKKLYVDFFEVCVSTSAINFWWVKFPAFYKILSKMRFSYFLCVILIFIIFASFIHYLLTKVLFHCTQNHFTWVVSTRLLICKLYFDSVW